MTENQRYSKTFSIVLAAADTNVIINLLNIIKFNGGGHVNHTIFWQNLSPAKSSPTQEFQEAVQK